MKPFCVTLQQMLLAREGRAHVQQDMLSRADEDCCLVCLTLNIAGETKRTPMTRMLFDRGVEMLDACGFALLERRILDAPTGTEGFFLLRADAQDVKRRMEAIEASFPAARLFDFDVLLPDGRKLSRAEPRRCLICSAPAAACARSRAHGLDAIRQATNALLRGFCAGVIAEAAHGALLDEVRTTPKPGLVDLANCGAHRDMDLALFEKSADSLLPYFRDCAKMGMELCRMAPLRARGLEAEREMFAATGGVNTHKGMVYSMGLLTCGMGRALVTGEDAVRAAAALAAEDADVMLRRSKVAPTTNGGAVYTAFGARGALGEAAAGFPAAVFCAERLAHYRARGDAHCGALALCDVMARLEDTNLLHRGGAEGLSFVRQQAAQIALLPEASRIPALEALDRELIRRNLSPGGSADMLALGLLLCRWDALRAELFSGDCMDKED